MGISYSAMVGVGCYCDDIEFNSLTDEAKGMFKDYAESQTTYYEEDDYYSDDEIWDDEYLRDAFLHDCLDMVDIDYDVYSGTVNTIGFDIGLDLETLHQEVEKATSKFKRYFNIEPKLLLGVSVW